MIFEQTHYRDYLKQVLTERIKQNTSYSLRALARQLGIQPSLLSEVLSGGRKLTEETAMKIANGLGLEGLEREYFRLLVQFDRAKSPSLREAILASITQVRPKGDEVHDLGVDLFRTIADWYHFALLRLSEIGSFEWTTPKAAQTLGIHPYEVEAAVKRLERLGVVRIEKTGRPRKVTQDLLVSSSLPNEALKKYHAQMLNKTIEALQTQTPSERFTGTEDLVLDAEQMTAARKIFEDCFAKVAALSRKRKGKASEVYHLGIHCFKLSQNKTETRKGKIL